MIPIPSNIIKIIAISLVLVIMPVLLVITWVEYQSSSRRLASIESEAIERLKTQLINQTSQIGDFMAEYQNVAEYRLRLAMEEQTYQLAALIHSVSLDQDDLTEHQIKQRTQLLHKLNSGSDIQRFILTDKGIETGYIKTQSRYLTEAVSTFAKEKNQGYITLPSPGVMTSDFQNKAIFFVYHDPETDLTSGTYMLQPVFYQVIQDDVVDTIESIDLGESHHIWLQDEDQQFFHGMEAPGFLEAAINELSPSTPEVIQSAVSQNGNTQWILLSHPISQWRWTVVGGIEIKPRPENPEGIATTLLKNHTAASILILIFSGCFVLATGMILLVLKRNKLQSDDISFFQSPKKTLNRFLSPDQPDPSTKKHLSSSRARKRARLEMLDINALDALTGMPNQKYMSKLMDKEWKRNMRQISPVSIGIIEIDHFSSLGESARSSHLKKISASLEEALQRPFDVIARMSDSRFMVLCPDTDIDGAVSVAREMKKQIRSLNLNHPSHPEKRITVSMGISSVVPFPGSTPDALIEKADHALMCAKDAGHDQIVVEHTVPPTRMADAATAI